MPFDYLTIVSRQSQNRSKMKLLLKQRCSMWLDTKYIENENKFINNNKQTITRVKEIISFHICLNYCPTCKIIMFCLYNITLTAIPSSFVFSSIGYLQVQEDPWLWSNSALLSPDISLPGAHPSHQSVSPLGVMPPPPPRSPLTLRVGDGFLQNGNVMLIMQWIAR